MRRLEAVFIAGKRLKAGVESSPLFQRNTTHSSFHYISLIVNLSKFVAKWKYKNTFTIKRQTRTLLNKLCI